jgi:MoxR-like ATPase
MATQNPIEQEGTYPLPEAQTDRFMLKVKVGYPSRDEELAIMDRMTEGVGPRPESCADPEALLHARKVVQGVFVDPNIKQYVVDIVLTTREPQSYARQWFLGSVRTEARADLSRKLDEYWRAARGNGDSEGRGRLRDDVMRVVATQSLATGEKARQSRDKAERLLDSHVLKGFIAYGASPRASIYLNLAARAHAFLRHRGYVIPEDVKSIGMDVLRHRVILTYEAEAEELTSEDIVQRVFDMVEVP